ncbi:hypothetical protein OAL09_05005 [Verrucomicrobia bacterium]|nr:hypothetical protein [Verrucomicrobiota bacterium]|tara:strand:- start:946 stop:1359 length:414 start_codon:yes stop_codon:yes gene_type:complete
MVSRIQKIKTLEQRIDLLKREASSELKKIIKQKEKEVQRLGQEFVQTFNKDFSFNVSVKRSDKKISTKSSSSRQRLTKEGKIKLQNQITKYLSRTPRSISEICKKVGRPVNQVRNVLKNIKGLKKQGAKRNTTYIMK